ncbi:female-specific protein transformer-like isoform X2 [Eurosta solidaginis]|uniref:female-specific protein transformer-like isoform X2 n=1 Tax=Eurosta solidaginis TaxID=178769 RepID=UPI003530A070
MKLGESRNSSLPADDVAVNSKSVINNGSNRDTENQHESERKRSSKNKEHAILKKSSSSPDPLQKNCCVNTKSSMSGDNCSSRRNETYRSTSGSHSLDKKHILTRRSLSPSTTCRRRTPEKIPYFIDEVRERDRLRRKYGIVSDKPSSSSSRSRRSRSISRTRHSSPKGHRRHRYCSTSEDDYSSRRYDSKYRHKSEDQERSRYRRRSCHSSSRSRTPSIERITRPRTSEICHSERRKYRHGEHDQASNVDFLRENLTQTQIITIPVPVPTDLFNYSYPTWPAAMQWNPHLIHPPRHGARAAYPILPGTVVPPIRPPYPLYGLPHPSIHYGGRGLRFRPNYGPTRLWHQNFRGRNT